MKTQFRIEKWGSDLVIVAVDMADTPQGPTEVRTPVRRILRVTSRYTPGAESPTGAPARRRWYQAQALKYRNRA